MAEMEPITFGSSGSGIQLGAMKNRPHPRVEQYLSVAKMHCAGLVIQHGGLSGQER